MRAFKNGFLYSFGKYVFYIFVLLFIAFIIKFFNIPIPNFLYIDEVHAIFSDTWYNDDIVIERAVIQSSFTNSTIINQGTNTSIPNTDHKNFIEFSNPSNNVLAFTIPQLNSHYAYAVRVYMCWKGSTPSIVPNKVYLGTSFKDFTEHVVSYSWTDLGNRPTPNYSSSYNTACIVLNTAFTPTTKANVMALDINSMSGVTKFGFYGVEVMPLGIGDTYLSTTLVNTITNSLAGYNNSLGNLQNSITSNANSNRNVITSNANSNANRIISNQNSNTETQISNANSNTDRQIANDNSNQAQTNSNLNKINDSINNDDVDNNQASSYFSNFHSDDFGLSDIVSIPLNYINQLSTNSCVPLSFTLPFVHQSVSLPCMNEVYNRHFSSFLTIWHIISTGIISYWVCINIFASVKGFKDPQSDKVEVLDL